MEGKFSGNNLGPRKWNNVLPDSESTNAQLGNLLTLSPVCPTVATTVHTYKPSNISGLLPTWPIYYPTHPCFFHLSCILCSLKVIKLAPDRGSSHRFSNDQIMAGEAAMASQYQVLEELGSTSRVSCLGVLE